MSNDTVVTLNKGLVTAIHAGKVTVTCISDDGGFSASCVVTVVDGTQPTTPVTGVSINKKALQLIVGNSEQLTASIQPTNASEQGVTWTSSNTSVATVSTSGKVSAKAEGVSTISCETVDGHYKAKCYLVVSAANSEYNYSFEPATPSKISYEATKVYYDELENNGGVFVTLEDNSHALYLLFFSSLTNGSIPAGNYEVSSSLQGGTICYSVGGDDTSDYGSFLATNFNSEGYYTAAYYIIGGTVIVGKNESYYAALISANGSDIEVTHNYQTDVVEVESPKQCASKIMQNGTIYIVRDNKVYSIMGNRVK